MREKIVEYRKVFKVVDGKKIEIKFSEIKKGMKIKLYEDDDISINNGEILTALTDSYKQKDGILGFEVDG